MDDENEIKENNKNNILLNHINHIKKWNHQIKTIKKK